MRYWSFRLQLQQAAKQFPLPQYSELQLKTILPSSHCSSTLCPVLPEARQRLCHADSPQEEKWKIWCQETDKIKRTILTLPCTSYVKVNSSYLGTGDTYSQAGLGISPMHRGTWRMESDRQLKIVSPPLLPLKANPSLFVPFNNNKKVKNIFKLKKKIHEGEWGLE